MPELTFDLSLGEVVIILIVTALILLIIVIERTGKPPPTKTKLPRTPTALVAMKDCPARFGFLQKLPRGSTMPQECYTCPLLIECLGFQRASQTRR